jgi:hypothetical protein
MKISCPGCKKTYEIPQELIDAILEKHRPKPTEIDPAFFPPAAEQPVIVPRRVNQWAWIKIVMLIVTLLWPVTIIAFTLISYEGTMKSPSLIDMGDINGQHLYGNLHDGPYVSGRSKERIATDAFIGSLFGVTVLYALSMTFLGVAWFATRR